MICDMCNPAKSSHQMMVQLGSQRDRHGRQQYSRRLWYLNNTWRELRGALWKYPSFHRGTITPPTIMQDGYMLYVIYAKCWFCHLNIEVELEIQTRKYFSNLLLSDSGEPVWNVASCIELLPCHYCYLPNKMSHECICIVWVSGVVASTTVCSKIKLVKV